jgi:predicted oxidoreductase (fatty acid repression mutant protein)
MECKSVFYQTYRKIKVVVVLGGSKVAPSSRNEQPWRYIIFINDNPEKLKNAQSVLKDINNYAKRAPILICAGFVENMHLYSVKAF